MGSLWKVEILGTFEAKAQGRVVSRFRTKRVASLLAYLALHPKRVHTRDEVAELLWPGSDEATSRRNLRPTPPFTEAGAGAPHNSCWISPQSGAIPDQPEPGWNRDRHGRDETPVRGRR